MSVINRRNALIGWAAWSTAKQIAKHKARKQLRPERGARRIAVPAALAATTATVAGAVLFWRRRARPAGVDEYAQ